eukprot:COSAG02_NODE_127_length_34879_cov_12.705060_1_plen_389_part_00
MTQVPMVLPTATRALHVAQLVGSSQQRTVRLGTRHVSMYSNGKLLIVHCRKLAIVHCRFVADRLFMLTDGQCRIVEEGEMVVSEVDATGNEYMLIEAGVSWSSARATCQASGGQLAEIRNANDEATISELMSSAGVTNAWICNEIILNAEYSNWGSDVRVSDQSAYYEAVDMIAPCTIGSCKTADTCYGTPTRDYQTQECECEDDEYEDRYGSREATCKYRFHRGDLTGDEEGCYCEECPDGMRVQIDRVEHQLFETGALESDQCIEGAQVYDGAMCGHVRTSGSQDDWGSAPCGDALPFVCNLSPQQDFSPHCFVPYFQPLPPPPFNWKVFVRVVGSLGGIVLAWGLCCCTCAIRKKMRDGPEEAEAPARRRAEAPARRRNQKPERP